MIHINNVFKESFRFINVEKIQKELVYVVDDFFAKRYNINKVQHSETQTLVKKYMILFINSTDEST